MIDRVAQWAAELTWADVPETARRRTVETFRDTITVLAAGTRTDAARLARKTAARQPGSSRLLFMGDEVTPTMAAFVHGVSGMALDFDDGHYLGGATHPSSTVTSALLTLAQELDPTMGELLTAQVVGVEIAIRTGYLSWPANTGAWYSCAGHHDCMGAAAACARLLGLDPDGIRRAMRIAWSHTPRAVFNLPMVKESTGWGAATAYTAARLAAQGYMAMAGGADSGDLPQYPGSPFGLPGVEEDPFVASLGQVFEAEQTYTKPYAACRYTHAAADGLRELLRDEDLDPEAIDEVRVGVVSGATFLTFLPPQTLEHAQYSYPWVLSAIALHGAAGPAEMSQERLTDPARRRFAEKVRVYHEPALDPRYPDRYPAVVTVVAGDRRVERRPLGARGDVDCPLSEPELVAKARDCLEPVLGPDAEPLLQRLADPLGASVAELLDVALAPVSA